MIPNVLELGKLVPWFAVFLSLGYWFGSIPSGVLVTRFLKLGDLRQIGSGNIGATNVLRTGNKLAAALTLFLDILKVIIPVLIVRSWGDLASALAAFGAFIGHLFPIWLSFKGGKGVATSFGALLTFDWFSALGCLIIWFCSVFLTRRSSVGGLLAALGAPVLLALRGYWLGFWVALLMGPLIIWKHQDNIRRLIEGTEPLIELNKEKK